MQRCTNCGAVVRPGAKFCTSCGTRLNLDQAPASDWSRPSETGETLVAAPIATASTPNQGQEEDQPTTAATDTDAAGSIVSETPDAEDQQAAAPTESQGPAATSSWSWGSTAASNSAPASPDDEAAPDRETETEEPVSDDASADQDRRSWSAEERADTVTEAESGATAATEGASESTAAAGADARWSTRWPLMGARAEAQAGTPPAETASTPGGEDASRSPADRFAGAMEQEDAATASVEAPREAPEEDAAASTGWSWEQQAADESDVVAESATIAVGIGEAAPEPAPEAATSESPRQRAASLLDELRALLPQIAAGDAVTDSGAGAASSAVAHRLAAARDQAGDFASLRRTLESAQQNPRDVDTMLDLVNRADRLLALLDGYERLTGEIDEAVTQLRNG